MKRPKTTKQMTEVFNKLMLSCDKKEVDEKSVSDSFNNMLDDLLDDDFFGTEGQSDPRGDHRDDE